MDDKENRRYEKLEDRKVTTCIDLGITISSIWKIIIIIKL